MSTPAPFWRFKPGWVPNYLIAVLSVAAAVAANLALDRFLGVSPSISLFLCAIMFVTWASGTGPALFATALSLLAFDYLFLQPIYSLAVELKETLRLVLFTVAALFVVWLNAAQRRATVLLQRARDEQQGTMRELQQLNEALRIENTERRHAEEKTRQAERELQATIDTIPALAARYQAGGAIEFVNQIWRDYTGLSQEGWKDRGSIVTHPDDRSRVENAWLAALANGEPFETEQRLRRADGEYRWHFIRRVPLRNDNGEVIAWYGAGHDIEDRKQAEDALRRSEAELTEARQELQLTIDTVPVLMLRHRADGIIDFVNQVGRNYTGLASTNWKKRTSVTIHPDDVSRIEEAWDVALATGEPFETEARLRRADGEYRWFVTRRVPLRNHDGDVIAWYAAAYDIEDRKRAEDALRRSEAELAEARQELQLTIDTISTMVVVLDHDGKAYYANRPAQDYLGRDLPIENALDAIHPDDRLTVEQLWRSHLETGEPFQTEQRMRRADGQYRWNFMTRVPRRDETGKVVRWYGSGYDIHDRKLAETALRKSEAQLAETQRELQLTLDSIPSLAWRTRADGFAEYLNKRWLDYTGLSQEQALGWDWQVAIHPDDRAGLHDAWLRMQTSGQPDEVEARMRRFDGAYRWFLFRTEALRDENGAVVAWYGTNTDIEDRKQVESALQRNAAYLTETQRLSLTGSFAWDVVSGRRFWSDQTYQIMGFDHSTKPSIDRLIERVHPDDRAVAQHQVNSAAQGANNLDYQIRLLMPDGKIKYLHVLAHRVRFESGNEEMVGALIDKTEIRKSQEALGAAQTALAHASRVATLGEISATIAHEVNQPLAAIVANGQACLRFLRRETPDLNDVRGAVEWIVKDGNRAAEVIQRVRGLLKKTDAEKVPLDLNEIINEVAGLLQRELAAHYVTPQLQLAPAIPLSIGDRVQLQQVIINLVMNGVEAMQGITGSPHALEIRSYEDEARVVVAVKDCGVGIPVEAADRLFDAFYSTKPSGLGIGLSICRSIIQDHGGRLWATHNNGGPGATFQFALPCYRSGVA